MSSKNLNNVKKILENVKIFYNLRTNRELAEFLNVDESTISQWKARNTLDYEKILTKCKNMEIDKLFYSEEEKILFVKEPQSEYIATKPVFENENIIITINIEVKNK